MNFYDFDDPEEVFDYEDDFDSKEEMYEVYEELLDEQADRRRRERANHRSSHGGGNHSNSEGCYIATAVYGSYDCPEVWVLRRFRDLGLRRSRIGTAIVKMYYWISPKLVKKFGKN